MKGIVNKYGYLCGPTICAGLVLRVIVLGALVLCLVLGADSAKLLPTG